MQAHNVVLTTYSADAQHWGTFLGGYGWNIYGCGTYREPVSPSRSETLMKRFMEERLPRRLSHAVVHYFAAQEVRYSGCGLPGIPLHWHFVASCDRPYRMEHVAQDLWTQLFGDAKIETFDPAGDGLYYISKLASHPNGNFLIDLPKTYSGPTNLVEAACRNPYVPDHLKDKTHGTFLAARRVRKNWVSGQDALPCPGPKLEPNSFVGFDGKCRREWRATANHAEGVEQFGEAYSGIEVIQ